MLGGQPRMTVGIMHTGPFPGALHLPHAARCVLRRQHRQRLAGSAGRQTAANPHRCDWRGGAPWGAGTAQLTTVPGCVAPRRPVQATIWARPRSARSATGPSCSLGGSGPQNKKPRCASACLTWRRCCASGWVRPALPPAPELGSQQRRCGRDH